jgi:hypothetical protein
VLTLFLVLSFGAVSVIIAGSAVYESIAGDMDENYEKRVTVAYLTTKIRQNDNDGIRILAEEVNGVSMLAIRETFWGWWEFVTYIYHDPDSGFIREIFLEVMDDGSTEEFALSDGEEIIASGGFGFSVTDRYVEISVTAGDGVTRSSRIGFRSGHSGYSGRSEKGGS